MGEEVTLNLPPNQPWKFSFGTFEALLGRKKKAQRELKRKKNDENPDCV